MSYSIWLPIVGLAGLVSGQIAGGRAFGKVADILLGLCGGFFVRFVAEQLGATEPVYVLLFSMWGAAAIPVIARWIQFKLPIKFGRFPSTTTH